MFFGLSWVIISLVVALFGVNRKLGFWGYFFISLFLSPVVAIVFILASDPVHRR